MDNSPAMIEIARQRDSQAEFHVASFLQFPIPPCRAVTALGEVVNSLFDPDHSLGCLEAVCKKVFDALSPGGLLIFDVAEPSRFRGQKQAFAEGDDWTCLVEYQHDLSTQQLTRRIVTYRKVGDAYLPFGYWRLLRLIADCRAIALRRQRDGRQGKTISGNPDKLGVWF